MVLLVRHVRCRQISLFQLAVCETFYLYTGGISSVVNSVREKPRIGVTKQAHKVATLTNTRTKRQHHNLFFALLAI